MKPLGPSHEVILEEDTFRQTAYKKATFPRVDHRLSIFIHIHPSSNLHLTKKVTAFFQTPSLRRFSMEDGGDFDLWMFVHDEQLDAALKTPNFDLDSQSLFEDAWGVGGTIGDSGDAMPTFRLVNSAVEKSVDLPAQSKPANQTEWEVVRAVIESGPHDETAMDIEV